MSADEFIRVKKETKNILDNYKRIEGHTSYDSVVRTLIERRLLPKHNNQSKEIKK